MPAGTSELFGEAMFRRLHALSVIESVYQDFGFDPLSTPILEHAQVFKGHHGAGETLLFNLTDCCGVPLVLRYDLTVPLARYVADHPDAPIPFKRYQIGQVFRDDEVNRGHFREFTQCDGDVIGVGDLSADADVIRLAYAGLSRLGFPNFTIRINHRMIIAAIANKAGLSGREGRLTVQRAMDYADKVTKAGLDGIRRDLEAQGLAEAAVATIIDVLGLTGDFAQKLSELGTILREEPEGLRGIAEIEEIVSFLPREIMDTIELDLSLARGADYYTGFILEGVIPGVKVGAVLGGGRYDRLVGNLGGPDLPSVGMAFGLERIMTAMTDLELWPSQRGKQRILVAPLTKDDERLLFAFAGNLRSQGAAVDYLPMLDGMEESVLQYAKRRGFTHIVMYEEHLTAPRVVDRF